jgi:hypothetical protein
MVFYVLLAITFNLLEIYAVEQQDCIRSIDWILLSAACFGALVAIFVKRPGKIFIVGTIFNVCHVAFRFGYLFSLSYTFFPEGLVTFLSTLALLILIAKTLRS